MEDFLRKYGLIDNVTLNLETDKHTFARKLAAKVDFGNTDAFSSAFEAWESSNNDYKGKVTNDQFEIRRRKKFFQSQGTSMPIIRGTFKEDRDKLIIDAEIKPNTQIFIPALIIVPLFYLVFISLFLFIPTQDDNSGFGFIFIPFILLHMCFMLGIPYFIMKRGVVNTKKNLKRDFFYIAHGEEDPKGL